MDKLKIPVVPMILMIIGGIVLLAGIAFMIFRFIFEKGESNIDPAFFQKIRVIAAWVFFGYVTVELIAAAACVIVNDACRNQYHYDVKSCPFCMSDPNYVKNHHSAASDCLTLGAYFDVFIVNAYVTNFIKIVKEKLESKKSQ